MILGERYGIPSVALRYSIVLGERQSLRNTYSGALRVFALQTLSNDHPRLFEDGYQQRDFISIRDVVSANLLVLTHDGAPGHCFNVGGERPIPLLELARLVVELLGGYSNLEVTEWFRAGDTRHCWSATDALRRLGWSPRVAFEDAVRDYLEWITTLPELPQEVELALRRMEAMGVLRPSVRSARLHIT